MRFDLDIPSDKTDRQTYRRLSVYQFVYSLCGLCLGLGCVMGGVVLFLHGVAGSASWTARLFGAESQVTDAAPGALLFVVGLFVVVVTRFQVRVAKIGSD